MRTTSKPKSPSLGNFRQSTEERIMKTLNKDNQISKLEKVKSQLKKAEFTIMKYKDRLKKCENRLCEAEFTILKLKKNIKNLDKSSSLGNLDLKYKQGLTTGQENKFHSFLLLQRGFVVKLDNRFNEKICN